MRILPQYDKLVSLISLALLAVCATFLSPVGIVTAKAASGFEPAEATLKASQVLPPGLAGQLKGPHYRVAETVVNKQTMNNFEMKTDFGDFAVFSNARLKKRIGEIPAIAQLSAITETQAFQDSLIAAGRAPIDAAVQVVTNPVETVKRLPGGLWNAIRDTGRDIQTGAAAVGDALGGSGSGDASQDEGESTLDKSAAAGKKIGATYLGVNRGMRSLASELQVDPYSRNPILQKELERVAWARSAGTLVNKFNPIRLPGVVGYIQDARRLVWGMSASQLRDHNKKVLAASGASESDIDAFLDNVHYIPSEQTVMVNALQTLEGVENRDRLVGAAAAADSPWEVLYYLRLSEMLASFHTKKAPLARIVTTDDGFAMAVTAKNRVVLPVPVDYLRWYAEAARVLTSLTDTAAKQQTKGLEAWIEGRVSDRAGKELARLGWQVSEGVLD